MAVKFDGLDHDTMVARASRMIERDYRSRSFYCDCHAIDKGNLSKALNNKGPLTNEMLEPLGYEKLYVPVYRRIEK